MKRKLFLLLCTLLTTAGSWAGILDGWTKMETNVVTNPQNYYFVILHTDNTLMLGVSKHCSARTDGVLDTPASASSTYDYISYQTASEPSQDLAKVWTIESCTADGYTSAYILRGLANVDCPANIGSYQWELMTDGAVHENNATDAAFNLEATGTMWKIQDATATTNYWGAWNNAVYINNERVAGNAGGNGHAVGNYNIYYMDRVTFNKKYQFLGGTNMNHVIVNRSFEYGNTTGWTTVNSADTGVKDNVDPYTTSGIDGSKLFNTWWEGKPLTQEIKNLPDGMYELKALIASSDADKDAKIFLLGGDGHSDVITITKGTKSQFNEYSYKFKVTDGSTTIGIIGGNDDGTYNENGHWWYKADNFRLTYLDGLQDLTPVIGKMNADVNTAQQNAISTYNSNKTVANYIAAQEAIANAEASVAAYANAASYLEKVEQLLATTNFYTTAAYNSVYGTYKTAYDNSTLDDATARDLSYKVAGSGGTARYDANTANDLLIPGWTIGGNDATTSGSGFYINTWSNEGNTDGSGMTTPFYECWTGDANQLEAKSIVGTLSGLTANSLYNVSALVRVRQQNEQTKADNGITFKVGDGAAVSAVDGTVCNTSFYYKTVSAFGMTDASGNLTVTFTVNENSHISWLSFKNVVYTEIGKGDASNLDFATGAVTDGICIRTYAKDITGSDVSGLQNVPGWIILNNGDQRAAGVMNVNSGTGLGNGANVVPPAGYDALSNGKVLGIEAVWTATTQYVQAVTLSAGNYKIVMPIYNQGGTVAFTKNLFGFVESDGTEHYATTTQYAVGSWTREVIDLTLAKESTGYLSLGYTSASNGNADMPHLFVDRVMICDASANMAVNATAKWGTFCAPFAVAIPSGVTAYTCESATSGVLNLEEVATTIPANTPVILNAESGLTSTTFYGKKVDNVTDDLITRGLLVGNVSTSTKDVPSDGSAYLLQLHGDKVGFYKANGTGYLIGSNRCYLVSENLSGAREAFFFEDDATAISALEAAKAEDGALKDGKYLIDGKIVIVKNGVKYGANGQKLN